MSDYEPNKTIPGTVYQVIRLLGHGGMGTVYEVEDTTVGKRYVLKTLHAQLRDRKELAERLNKEARVLARLSHPNIVEVVTAGMTGDRLRLPYFLMQKLNGYTLRAVLAAKGSLPLETAFSIAIDLLDALEHAHSMGVIHRDVKPENIFLHRGPNETHQTKLLDFGVMRMLSGEHPQTGARFVGTLRYAPPEQLRGGAITARTDLYSAGLVLYEMLTGSGPFDDETTDRAIANAHLERAPAPLSSRAAVSPELEALVMSALAKDPAGRPRDAATFAARLRELLRLEDPAHFSGTGPGAGMAAVLSGLTPPPVPTSIDLAASRPRSTTLENADPPPTSAPIHTLRLEPPSDAIDRSARTRTSAPLGADGESERSSARSTPNEPPATEADPPRSAATTTGAISSHATMPRRSHAASRVALALAALLILGGGLALRARAKRAAAPAPAAVAPAAPTAPATATATAPPPPPPPPTPTPTATATATPTATATAAPTPTASAPPRPRAAPPPRRLPPALAPAPAPAAAAAASASAPAKPRLPGPGF